MSEVEMDTSPPSVEAAGTGRIVVGVDGSTQAQAALQWALQEAELRGVPVQVVMAWRTVPVYNAPNIQALSSPIITDQELAASAQAEVERIARDAGQDGKVTVTGEAPEGHPARVLIDAAADAGALVVGSRGHGGFVGALLGSVSQHVVAHAMCPVVVVPDPQRPGVKP